VYLYSCGDHLLSFDALIFSGRIDNIERFQLAFRLTKLFLSLYNSPWICEWSTKTIYFLDKHTSVTSQIWIPHIPVAFSSGAHTRGKNMDIHELGLILLQLGCGKRLEDFGDGEDKDAVLKMAILHLGADMGGSYCKVVENFIRRWNDENLDLMENDDLLNFISNIDILEKLAEEHSSRYSYSPDDSNYI